jgi:hypothetical protein
MLSGRCAVVRSKDVARFKSIPTWSRRNQMLLAGAVVAGMPDGPDGPLFAGLVVETLHELLVVRGDP